MDIEGKVKKYIRQVKESSLIGICYKLSIYGGAGLSIGLLEGNGVYVPDEVKSWGLFSLTAADTLNEVNKTRNEYSYVERDVRSYCPRDTDFFLTHGEYPETMKKLSERKMIVDPATAFVTTPALNVIGYQAGLFLAKIFS